jgi:carbonic anhydrase/acetyltransferase-like protein (isoleucine patch superfamily)
MIRHNPQSDFPKVDRTAYVDPSAVIIGKVRIGRNVFVAPGAVIRADEQGSFVIIGDGCNIQDRVVVHALGKSSVNIGKNTSLSHGSIVHGPCKIGKSCFVGFGSVIFKAIIKDNVFIKMLAVIEGVDIPGKKCIPNGAIICSPKAVDLLRTISSEEASFAQRVIKTNLRLVKNYKQEVVPCCCQKE